MRRIVGGILVCLTMVTFGVPAEPQDPGLLLRVRIEARRPAALRTKLETAGFDVLRVDTAASIIELAVSPAELDALERSGLKVVLVQEGQPLQETLQHAGVVTAAVPANYRALDGILTRMNEIAAAYPTIAQVVDLTATYGTPVTFEGRHLFALNISDNVGTDEDEPAVLIVSNHHAREIVTPVIALDAAERLTGGYGSDPRITAAVDNHEIWIAPVWNPDGYNYMFTVDNLWRKNRRVFVNGVGVDQNRNYPQGWNASCSGSTSVSSSSYKGPSAASEPETQTMMTWSQNERFAKVIDYHSSGRETLYAYRCLSHPFSSWFQQQAAAISQASGYGTATRLPSAEGEEQEWQFAQMGAYAFLIETHNEFQPPYDSAVAEAALVWPGILQVIERPISVSGHVTDAASGVPLAAAIELLNISFSNGETNSSGGPFGRYHIFVPPGAYSIRFSKPGYGPVTQAVTVASSSAMTLNIQLSPVVTVFSDDFESDRGWTRNPNGIDTATAGLWERGDPQSTSSSGPKQLGTTVNGVNDLVTGRLAGSSAGTHDVDGGMTSIQSPPITLPASGNLTLSFSYYLAHGSNSSIADFLRVRIIGSTTATVFEKLGVATDVDGAWTSTSASLNAFAGETIRILIEAADAGGGSLVEAAVDDVKVVRQ